MVLTTAQIAAWVGEFLWPFMRIAMMFSVMPIFGGRLVPMRVRLMVAVAITILVVPIIPPVPSVDPLSATALLITVQQLLIGMSLALMQSGRGHEAVAALVEGLLRQPDDPELLSTLAATLNYRPGVPAPSVFDAHRRAGEVLSRRAGGAWSSWTHMRGADRKLRVSGGEARHGVCFHCVLPS